MNSNHQEVIRALKFHTDLVTLLLTKLTMVEAKQDVIFASVQEVLLKHGVAKQDSQKTLDPVLRDAVQKHKKVLKDAVASLEEGAPPSVQTSEFGNN